MEIEINGFPEGQTTTGDLRTKYYDGSGNVIAVIPLGYNVVGTCGKCGGPIIQSMMQGGPNPPRTCLSCGRSPKNAVWPSYGPIQEMEDK
jgi:hypothetical protein